LPLGTVYPSEKLARACFGFERATLHAELRESCAERGWSYGSDDERIAEALQALGEYHRSRRPSVPLVPVAVSPVHSQPLLLFA